MRGIKVLGEPLSGRRQKEMFQRKGGVKAAIVEALSYIVYLTFPTQPGDVNAHCERRCDLRSLQERMALAECTVPHGLYARLLSQRVPG